MIKQGIDPSLEKKLQKELRQYNAENTFEAIAMEWYENRKEQWTPRYGQEILKRLKKDVFPVIGMYPIKDIKAPILLNAIRKIESRDAGEVARRQLQKCGEIFRYAIGVGKAEVDPTYGLKDVLKPIKKTHYAALDIKELPEFIAALERNDPRLYRNTRNAVRLRYANK